MIVVSIAISPMLSMTASKIGPRSERRPTSRRVGAAAGDFAGVVAMPVSVIPHPVVVSTAGRSTLAGCPHREIAFHKAGVVSVEEVWRSRGFRWRGGGDFVGGGVGFGFGGVLCGGGFVGVFGGRVEISHALPRGKAGSGGDADPFGEATHRVGR